MKMRAIIRQIVISWMFASLFVPNLAEITTRGTFARFMHKGCKSYGTAFYKQKVSSLLYCQQLCTARTDCHYIAFKEQRSGVMYCSLYDLVDIPANCTGSKNWATYIVDRKSQATPSSEESKSIISYVFPNSSVTNFITTTSKEKGNITSFTVSMWVKFDQILNGGASILSYRSLSGAKCHNLLIKWNPLTFIVTINSANTANIFSHPPLKQYTHIGVTWSSSNAKLQLFVNGTLKSTHTMTSAQNAVIQGDGIFYIGIHHEVNSMPSRCIPNSASTFVGEISQVYMWNKELSSASIVDAMNLKAPVMGRIYDWNNPGQKNGIVYEKLIDKSTFSTP